ncbi:beta-1,4-glucuronyltransferase 1 [Diabrotica virgifera virgifera]|uniref:Beta-1,4-glucuronyltransferase 1-like n=1 Tax=Diabrotica virgifera virgifera TaxID=50390 RepID=A0A6P7F5Z3_DIAVI|nr:beta-1,4-glucuronyltransferase 1 [Diabrotica virgifera virgifera]
MRKTSVIKQLILRKHKIHLIAFLVLFSIFTLTHIAVTHIKPAELRTLVKLKCQNVVLKPEIEYRGNYVVFKNFVRAKKSFDCDESITLSAPGDYRFLDNIEPLVERWQGPISVALYAPGYDFYSTLQSIAYLRKCSNNSALISDFVTFHLFFDNQHFPERNGSALIEAYADSFDCSQRPPYETKTDEDMYKQKNNLFYPINVARNVAKLNVQTHFVFPSDIELYPTRNFIPKFFEFISRSPQYFTRDARNVFVFPLFEILADHKIPETKTQLQRMLKDKSAFGFHSKVCAVCHNPPKMQLWIESNETQSVDIFTSCKRQGRQKIWEPFFVCTQKEPLWDERLNWEGQGNKMCQAFHLCMLDYDFQVFDNAFLIHKPGVKKKKVQNVKYHDQQTVNNNILKHIQKELTSILGITESTSKCIVHNIGVKTVGEI